MKKIFSCVILVVLSISLLTLTINVKQVKADAGPKIIYVDDDNVLGPWYGNQTHPYQNITSGLEHASANASDTIFVYDGTYNEDLVVNKTVCLKGENRNATTISGTGTKNVVDVTADNVTICSFTINNSHIECACIYAETHNLTIENCKIINRNLGISLESSSHVNITNNIIIGGTYAGIALVCSDHASITYNKIANGLNRKHGIDINGSATITVVYNNITSNLNGVFLCNGEGDYGDITISNNYIANNTNGIEIFLEVGYSSSATIISNNIFNNTYAVYQHRRMGYSCSPHNFYHNNFIGNTHNNITFHGTAVAHNWDDGYPSGGNYWSNYNGTDVHSGPGPNQTGPGWDGIGDAAYSVGQNNSDNYPVMNPWPLAHLRVHTYATGQGEIEDVSVWVDETEPGQNSTAYFLLKYGTYTVKVQSSFVRQDPSDPTKHCNYTFDHWENGSNQNPRTIRLTTDRVLTAYYKVWVHLRVHTFADGQGEIEGVKVWVNVTEQPQYSPADFLLELGIYTVKVETSFTRQDPQDPTKYYRYYFDHWENGSKQNPRTITLTSDKLLTAYYRVQVMYIEAPPRG